MNDGLDTLVLLTETPGCSGTPAEMSFDIFTPLKRPAGDEIESPPNRTYGWMAAVLPLTDQQFPNQRLRIRRRINVTVAQGFDLKTLKINY